MKIRSIKFFGWLLVLLVGGCVDPYRPAEIAAPGNYLVVNGFFNSEPGTTTTIFLSRTQNLTDTKTPTAETKAKVTIESAHNATYTLAEGASGTYSLSGVVPQSSETYRLHIRTAGGTDYYSDYVPVVTTPAIDSVSWHVENDAVQINVNTHDPQNKTHYYRWDYDETWEYSARYYSSYELKNNQIVSRTDDIFHCWGSNSSKNIMVNSTARLSKDLVSQYPLTAIAGTSVKFESKYSILVRQYALTETGYDYYDQLAKITQNIGSLFDPQPSQITGNIHSATNPADLVLGFFRVGSVATKRIFIKRSQLPGWTTITGYEDCTIDTLNLTQIRQNQPGIITMYDMSRYLTSSFTCVDCRLHGGVTKKPDFWE